MSLLTKCGTILVCVLALPASGHSDPPVAQRVEILASRYSFEPREITVKKGVPVTITIHSIDVTHGLVIEDLGVLAEFGTAHPKQINFTASTVGTFSGRCAHFCGRGHRKMTLIVHVVE